MYSLTFSTCAIIIKNAFEWHLEIDDKYDKLTVASRFVFQLCLNRWLSAKIVTHAFVSITFDLCVNWDLWLLYQIKALNFVVMVLKVHFLCSSKWMDVMMFFFSKNFNEIKSLDLRGAYWIDDINLQIVSSHHYCRLE